MLNECRFFLQKNNFLKTFLHTLKSEGSFCRLFRPIITPALCLSISSIIVDLLRLLAHKSERVWISSVLAKTLLHKHEEEGRKIKGVQGFGRRMSSEGVGRGESLFSFGGEGAIGSCR